MLTWNTFKRNKNGGLSREEVSINKVDYGVSVTDKSKYNPNLSSFISNMGSIKNNPLYDFLDGKDTGVRMSLFHDKSLDITEKQAIFERFKVETENRLAELEEELMQEIKSKKDNDSNSDFKPDLSKLSNSNNSFGEAAD